METEQQKNKNKETLSQKSERRMEEKEWQEEERGKWK
jgi:hypothetical protein